MSLNALATAATENGTAATHGATHCVSGPPTAPKKKGDSDNKKRIRSQAFKADKLIQILLKYGAIEDVSDVAGLQKYIEECDHVSRSSHVDH